MYEFETTEADEQREKEKGTYIVETVKITTGDSQYPTHTYHKLIKVEHVYKIYSYITDLNTEQWAQRELPFPKKFDEATIIRTWEEYKKHIKGAEIGRGPVFWDVSLTQQGKIDSNPSEDWNTPINGHGG
jgi:hypothetical protein